MVRKIRHIIYRFLPPINNRWHAKKRKGQQSKWRGEQVLECQVEQDRIFWEKVLGQRAKETFWELDAGDGVTGSHGISLEESHGWKGVLWEERQKPAVCARKARQSSVLGDGSGFFNSLIQKIPSPDLIILRNKVRLGDLVHKAIKFGVSPKWMVIESAHAEAETARLMRSVGYRMVWAFHDDEYYQWSGR